MCPPTARATASTLVKAFTRGRGSLSSLQGEGKLWNPYEKAEETISSEKKDAKKILLLVQSPKAEARKLETLFLTLFSSWLQSWSGLELWKILEGN